MTPRDEERICTELYRATASVYTEQDTIMILVMFKSGIEAEYNQLAIPSFWGSNSLTPSDIASVTYTSKGDKDTVDAYVKALGITVPVTKVSADRGKEPVNADSKKVNIFNRDAECGKQLDNIQMIVEYLNSFLNTAKSDVRIHVYFSYK